VDGLLAGIRLLSGFENPWRGSACCKLSLKAKYELTKLKLVPLKQEIFAF